MGYNWIISLSSSSSKLRSRPCLFTDLWLWWSGSVLSMMLLYAAILNNQASFPLVCLNMISNTHLSAHCVTKEHFVTFFLVRFFNGLLSFRQIVYFLISDSYCYSLVCLCLFSAVTALVTKKFVCLLKINMESQLFGILLGFHIICVLT